MINKPEIREQLLASRRQMRTADIVKKSSSIIELLIKDIPWHDVDSLSTYYPAPGWAEVDTSLLLDNLWLNQPHIKTAGLRVLGKNQLENIEISPKTMWHKHRWGMLEPIAGHILPPDFKFDVVVMPALGFDRKGYRVGYGGGFYDRFLAGQPEAIKIGLAYADAEVQNLPHEPHDIPIDKIITEEGIINCHADE